MGCGTKGKPGKEEDERRGRRQLMDSAEANRGSDQRDGWMRGHALRVS